ncbi:uncharacterized protein LOC132642115 [Lycium barbarum]|uniref:uncharacterized protein LOC132642115 n=1 Tax=Lycium barbarum TaxID=112863 RepID=UPI00293E7688|nr:uncharacterized protein LOC132642115 [Lycium barbarum]
MTIPSHTHIRRGNKNPNKHVSFKRFISASVTQRVTCKQVAVAGTNSKDIKAVLKSRSDIPACLSVEVFWLTEQEKLIYTQLLILLGDRDKFEGKLEQLFNPLLIMVLMSKIILTEIGPFNFYLIKYQSVYHMLY